MAIMYLLKKNLTKGIWPFVDSLHLQKTPLKTTKKEHTGVLGELPVLTESLIDLSHVRMPQQGGRYPLWHHKGQISWTMCLQNLGEVNPAHCWTFAGSPNRKKKLNAAASPRQTAACWRRCWTELSAWSCPWVPPTSPWSPACWWPGWWRGGGPGSPGTGRPGSRDAPTPGGPWGSTCTHTEGGRVSC